MESTFHRFWRYENSTMSLVPVDESEPRLGGKVQVKSFVVDFRTLTLAFQTQYGIYSDNMVTYGTFEKGTNPFDDEELLLQIVEDDSQLVTDKTTFKFDSNELHFERQVNEDKTDSEINHAIEKTKLDIVHDDTWTELMFYGVGNKNV